MLEPALDRKISAYAQLAHKLLMTEDPVLSTHGVSLLIYTRELLREACKDNLIDNRNMLNMNGMVDNMIKTLRAPEEPKLSYSGEQTPRASEASVLLRNRSRRSLQDGDRSGQIASVEIEKEMLMMTHDMKDAANLMHSTIRKDIKVLAATADTQDLNLSDTQNQNVNARNIRSAKRLGFILTIVMMVSSLLIFVSLVPLILVT